MSVTSRLALFLLVELCTQGMNCVVRAQNPWSSAGTAEAFIQNFMRAIAQSGAFTEDQIDDMSAIEGTLMAAIDKMARSNNNSKSNLQALDLAFASSVAEIAVVKQEGQSIAAKTIAIEDALNSAFLQTTGSVNAQFVNEIQSLITLFAQNNANQMFYGGSSGEAAASASVSTAGGYGGYGTGPGDSSSYLVSVSSSGPEGNNIGLQGPSGTRQRTPSGSGQSIGCDTSGSVGGNTGYDTRHQYGPSSSSYQILISTSNSGGGLSAYKPGQGNEEADTSSAEAEQGSIQTGQEGYEFSEGNHDGYDSCDLDGESGVAVAASGAEASDLEGLGGGEEQPEGDYGFELGGYSSSQGDEPAASVAATAASGAGDCVYEYY